MNEVTDQFNEQTHHKKISITLNLIELGLESEEDAFFPSKTQENPTLLVSLDKTSNPVTIRAEYCFIPIGDIGEHIDKIDRILLCENSYWLPGFTSPLHFFSEMHRGKRLSLCIESTVTNKNVHLESIFSLVNQLISVFTLY
ncbi:MAG: hypothetical protein E7286_07515 [Lachnospiraceae bacterium]|nr:hypothetical protein [Lachnospiraceae bacterium]